MKTATIHLTSGEKIEVTDYAKSESTMDGELHIYTKADNGSEITFAVARGMWVYLSVRKSE